MLSPLASCALVTAPSIGGLKLTWQSLLEIEGSVIWSTGLDDIQGLVMMSCIHGVVLWKGSAVKVGEGFSYFVLDSSDNPWVVLTIWDPDEWKCCEVAPLTHDLAQASAGSLSAHLPPGSPNVFELGLEEEPELIRFSARRGFPHMTLEKLHLLWHELIVEHDGRKPHLLVDVLQALCEWVLGGLAAQQWEAVQEKRRSYTNRDLWHSVVEEHQEFVKDFCHETDVDVIAPQKPRKERSVVNKPTPPEKAAPTENPKAAVGAASSSSGSGAGSSSDAAEQPEQPKRRKLMAKFEEIVLHRPRRWHSFSVKGSTISLVAHRSWQVKYSERTKRPLSHTITYYEAEGQCVEHCKSLAQCVRWSWNIYHEEMGGEGCPWDLEAILAR